MVSKVNKILTTNVKSGEVRDRDEELFNEAYEQAEQQLLERFGEEPKASAITELAYRILGHGQ